MAWIEGIGSDQDPFYPFLCLHDGCESSYTTLCYDSAGTQLYEDAHFSVCDTTIVGMEDLERTEDITISPNPFTHSFRINADARMLFAEVYSLVVEMVGRFDGREDVLTIELPQHLSTGIYVVRIRTGHGALSKKIFKLSP